MAKHRVSVQALVNEEEMLVKKIYSIIIVVSLATAAAIVVTCSGCAETEDTMYVVLDVPMEQLHTETKKYVGTTFEGHFKFYQIYHDKETADPSKRGQVIVGKTHFTARPVNQNTHVVRINITPQQERLIRSKGIERQDIINARVRFDGISPGGALAFDLLEIIE